MNELKMIKVLGEGGNSTAFLVKRISDGKLLTYKRAKMNDGEADVHSIKSFENEARILNSLEHNAIPKFYGKRDEGILLEYFDGVSLENRLFSVGAFSEKEASGIALELAEILRYLHGRREPVIYRDLKPANIVLREDGHIALIDFGAARIYRGGDKRDTINLGTYGFAAPEQFGNLGQTDPRTDIYCFGMTILQLISGVDIKDAEAVQRFRQNGVSGVSDEFMQIIEKCIRPDREDRFRSAREIQRAIMLYPKLVRKRKARSVVRLAVVAAAAAAVLSAGIIQFDTVVAYAASDMEVRLPAMQQRLYNTKIWIEENYDNFCIYIRDNLYRIGGDPGNRGTSDI